jgi:hypothetical protein
MEIVLVLAVLAVVVVLITGPLRQRRPTGGSTEREAGEQVERAELEAAREAKYREIRDAELDYRTGKLSRGDWRAQDSTLRAEAIELLRRLDALESTESSERADNGPRSAER